MKRIEVSKTSSKGIVMGNVFVAREQDLSPEEKVIEVGQADAEKAAGKRYRVKGGRAEPDSNAVILRTEGAA